MKFESPSRLNPIEAEFESAETTRAEVSLKLAHRLRWLGHSAWEVETAGGARVYIDPWLSGNPVATVALSDLKPAVAVLITHDHSDHAGDAVDVTGHTGATLVGQPEVVRKYGNRAKERGKEIKTLGMNIGGTTRLGGIQITMTEAYHSSETGTPAGYILTLEDGRVVYHMGDTGLHINMSTWGELFDIDVVLIPIGDHFTMGGRQAARALKWLKPKHAIPMHYKTAPLLAQSADELVRHAAEHAPEVAIHVLEPGETFELA